MVEIDEWFHRVNSCHFGDRTDCHIPRRLEEEWDRDSILVASVDHPMLCRSIRMRCQRIDNIANVDHKSPRHRISGNPRAVPRFDFDE